MEGVKLTNLEAMRRMRERNIEPLENYVNKRIKIKVFCMVCNHEWMAIPGNIFQGCGCPACGLVKRGMLKRLPKNKLNSHLLKLADRGITMVSQFSTTRAKSIFRCKCGREWQAETNSVFK